MFAQHIGSLIWFIFCVAVGLREIYGGLPDVRERIRIGKGTEQALKRLKKKKIVGLLIIIGPGFCMTLPDLFSSIGY